MGGRSMSDVHIGEETGATDITSRPMDGGWGQKMKKEDEAHPLDALLPAAHGAGHGRAYDD